MLFCYLNLVFLRSFLQLKTISRYVQLSAALLIHIAGRKDPSCVGTNRIFADPGCDLGGESAQVGVAVNRDQIRGGLTNHGRQLLVD